MIAGCRGEPMATGDAGSALFDQLFGGRDGALTGRSCGVRHDDCRGSQRLLVCTGGHCAGCADAAQCQAEYVYLDPSGENLACVAGSCELAGTPIGTCGATTAGTACRTQQLGWFPCVAGGCARCQTAVACQSTYGPGWQCSPSGDGQCVEPSPAAP